jgi:DNA-binding NarL/FixJ family response regulator
LIVDDHAVVRSGLRLLIDAEDDLETAGEAASAREAIFEARSLKPDVILLDVVMPEQSGLEAIPQLVHENPDAKVLVLSMQDEPRYVREAFETGASGYVLKEAADSELVAAIREVAKGGRYVHPELGARLVADGGAPPRRRGSALGARARGAAPAGARAHQPGDRQAALHLGAHGRDAPGAHHAEASPDEPRRARPLRARPGIA